MPTELADVGLQIWGGALFLCDYLLDIAPWVTRRGTKSSPVALELGSGTGLVAVCLAAIGYAVIATGTVGASFRNQEEVREVQ